MARFLHCAAASAVAALALTSVGAVGAEAGPESDVVTAAAAHDGASSDPSRAGIWKAVVPPAGSMHGEFDGNDPIGVVAGVKIEADCSINWTDPDDRRLYCFSSATSLVFFLDAPQDYLRRARKQWRQLNRSIG
jgi:hypothetical protein